MGDFTTCTLELYQVKCYIELKNGIINKYNLLDLELK